MFFDKRKKGRKMVLALILAVGLGSASIPARAYVSTNRDTGTAPERAEYTPAEYEDYELLLETGTVKYYWREDGSGG